MARKEHQRRIGFGACHGCGALPVSADGFNWPDMSAPGCQERVKGSGVPIDNFTIMKSALRST